MTTQANQIGTVIPNYTGNIRVSARRCMPLALRLAQTAPSDVTSEERERLAAVHARGLEVDEVMTQRERGSGAVLREPRNRAANAWSGLYQRMVAAAALPSEVGPEGPEAAELTANVFPEGVAFTQLDAVESWQHSRRLLQRLTDEGLTARVEAVSGALFLRAVERAVDQLGAAIGVRGTPVVPPSPRALADAVTRFSYAVGGYTRTLAARVNEANEASIERFLSAVAPIDEMRATREGGDEETDDEQVGRPVAPDAPGGPFGPPDAPGGPFGPPIAS